jgi:hypothetical protein
MGFVDIYSAVTSPNPEVSRSAGFDHEKGVFSPFGSPSQRVTFTSQSDIARSLAELSLLASQPSMSSKVPDCVRIAGSTASFQEIAALFPGHIHIKALDMAVEKAKVKTSYLDDSALPPAGHLR